MSKQEQSSVLIVIFFLFPGAGGGNDIQWCFSQVKGAVDDDVAEGKKTFNNAIFEYRIFSKSSFLKYFLAAESVT